MPETASSRKIITVSELNRSVARLLETEFAWVWVEGEISNLARPASGHIYFSLKDSDAQVRCAMFRSRLKDLRFKPENGMKVMIRGKVSLYEARGDFQIIADKMEEAGAGDLQRQFEELKSRLNKDGLFDPDSKQDIPAFPRTIGIITSRSGAAIRDVLSVIARRYPSVPVKLLPVPVQGAESAPAICSAIYKMDKHKLCDVLLLVRGGGSIEDLWSFNEESVARAMHLCSIPIISGVGHETDVTIADFVADHRAATPTAAAEAATPDQRMVSSQFAFYSERLEQLITERTNRFTTRFQHLQKRLEMQHPSAVLLRLNQRLDELSHRLQSTQHVQLERCQHRLSQALSDLRNQSPDRRIQSARHRLQMNHQQMRRQMDRRLQEQRYRVGSAATTLNALSPLQTLSRGYSITCDVNGKAILNTEDIKVGDEITSKLHQGRIVSKVRSLE